LLIGGLESLTKLAKVSPANQRASQGEKRFMNVSSPLVADPQPAPLRQPGQGPFHHPAVETQATPALCAALGQHGRDPSRSQLLPMGRRIIAAVALHPARPTAGAPTPAPHGRNSLQQGQQLRDIVPMCPGHQCCQWNSSGIREHMMLTAALAAIGGIRAGFFPRRRPPGGSDYPRPPATSRSGPRRGAWPGAWCGAVARPRCGANRGGAASRSCRSRSPSPEGASPKECRTSGQRESRLMSPGPISAVGHPAAWAAQTVAGAPAAPTGHRVQVLSPCTHNTLT
jgi:hypothetical protein